MKELGTCTLLEIISKPNALILEVDDIPTIQGYIHAFIHLHQIKNFQHLLQILWIQSLLSMWFIILATIKTQRVFFFFDNQSSFHTQSK
jgi:hypothetical protein